MQKSVEVDQRSHIRCPGLPLAVYREVAAHLRQVEGVKAGLLPQASQQFDYNESQVGGLWIEFSPGADSAGRAMVEQILAYYSNRYRPWEDLKVLSFEF